MKKRYLAIALFYVQLFFAQVGINTTFPNAQLDIRSANQAVPQSTDGILIPKIDVFPSTNPNAAQQGMLVYLTTLTGSSQPGFYYWDNATLGWIPILSGTLPNGTLDNAYDFGGVGAGRTITADAGAVTISGTDGFVSTGTVGSGAVATSFSGAKLMWNPRKAAFRAGRVFTTEWDDANLGQYSVAFGYEVTANGHNATAFGGGTVASGQRSTAFGSLTTASGLTATAFGEGTLASGSSSIAFGEDTVASGIQSTAFGNESNATGSNSTAFGRDNTASGSNTTAFGRLNTAYSYGETVLGIGATAYTPTSGGTTQFRTANATDRLFVVGNAIDANNNNTVDTAERSDAMVILKNGNVGLGSASPQAKLHVAGSIRMVDGNQGTGKVLTSDANGTASWGNVSANAWGLTGNTATSATTNFIGTTDNIDLVFKTNNQDNFRIKNDGRIEAGNQGTNPTYLGSTSTLKRLFLASDGSNNNMFFQNSNASGDPISTYFGVSTGTTLAPTISMANQNVANLFFSAYDGAKFVNTAGINCALEGTPSLNNMPGSLTFLTTPAGGSSPLGRMIIKNNGNIGIGTTNPLDKLHIAGSMRMVDGNQATGKIMTSDANGTATWQTLTNNDWGLTGNTGTSSATNFIGTTDNIDLVFKRFNARAGLLGATNTSFGSAALSPTSTGTNNTAIGSGSLDVNTTGSDNAALGFNTLTSNATGSHNTAMGVAAMVTNSGGGFNTAIGRSALFDNTSGSNNTALGYSSLGNVTTGTNNTAVGSTAFTAFTQGSNNTAIGAETSSTSSIFENATAIGYKATVGNSNVMVLGSINGVNGATSSVNVGIGTSSPQTALEVVDASVTTSSTVEGNLNVVSNDPQAIDLGGSISLGGTNNDAGTLYRTFGTIEGRKANSTTANNLGYLLFKTNNGVLGERMRITSSGDVGIGTDTPGGQFELSLNEGRKPGSTVWTMTSDARLKTVNGDFTMGLAEIKQLHPIRYHYKNVGVRKFEQKVLETEFSGFLAQDVQKVFPNCVTADADGYLSLNVHDILIASVNAIKELDAKNDQLQSENEALKKKLQEHERQIAAILAELEKRK